MKMLATFGAIVVSTIWVVTPILAWTVLAKVHDLYAVVAVMVSFVAWLGAFCALHRIFIEGKKAGNYVQGG